MLHTHGSLEVHQFPCLADNYGFLVRDRATGRTAAIDTPEADAIASAAAACGWSIDEVWNTHWHPDHTGGNAALKATYGATVTGPVGEKDRIPTLDRTVTGGDAVRLGDSVARVLDTPGHTSGHIVYHFAEAGIAFVGDTVFSLGCGRLFEGTPRQMWASLSRLRDLPDETTLYCAHEYTQANARFSESLGEDNPALARRIEEVDRLRADGTPTVPMKLGQERAANPFLRADDPALAEAVGLPGADPVDVFAEVRARKDRF